MLRLPEFVFYLDSSKRLLQDPKFAYEMASAPGVAFGLVHRPLCDARVLTLHGHNGGHLESQNGWHYADVWCYTKLQTDLPSVGLLLN